MSFILEFAAEELGDMPGLGRLTWRDFWSRSFYSGGSEAHLGAQLAIVISKPFTAGENAVFAWLSVQDDSVLRSWYGLEDGRDLFLLDRMFARQSRQEALEEQQAQTALKLESVGIIKPRSSQD